ncbi:MAG: hypothetical protein M3Y56_14910 [Armatimonadota bacterium]|nr:hypothetical protein [Armatimonadota bacterium]
MTEISVDLASKLEDYNQTVAAWLDQSKKETAAVQRLQKAVLTGNLRDIEKLRQSAAAASEAAAGRATACEPLEFDVAEYLSSGGNFLDELTAAAEKAGVRLSVREGIVFCYPVIIRAEPDLSAVRIDKRLEPRVHPEVLAAELKKVQNQEPKARPDRFIETLLEAYELLRAKRGIDSYVAQSLKQIYEILTLRPGSGAEYTLLDFTRDIYFLDASGIETTRQGFRKDLTYSTGSRERSAPPLPFVTRDGYEKTYATIKFSPPDTGE